MGLSSASSSRNPWRFWSESMLAGDQPGPAFLFPTDHRNQGLAQHLLFDRLDQIPRDAQSLHPSRVAALANGGQDDDLDLPDQWVTFNGARELFPASIVGHLQVEQDQPVGIAIPEGVLAASPALDPRASPCRSCIRRPPVIRGEDHAVRGRYRPLPTGAAPSIPPVQVSAGGSPWPLQPASQR